MHICICMYCSILFLDSQHLYVSARHPNTYHVNFSKCPCRLPADWPWTGLISQVSVDKNTSPKMNRKDSLRHVFGYEVEFPKIGREIHSIFWGQYVLLDSSLSIPIHFLGSSHPRTSAPLRPLDLLQLLEPQGPTQQRYQRTGAWGLQNTCRHW